MRANIQRLSIPFRLGVACLQNIWIRYRTSPLLGAWIRLHFSLMRRSKRRLHIQVLFRLPLPICLIDKRPIFPMRLLILRLRRNISVGRILNARILGSYSLRVVLDLFLDLRGWLWPTPSWLHLKVQIDLWLRRVLAVNIILRVAALRLMPRILGRWILGVELELWNVFVRIKRNVTIWRIGSLLVLRILLVIRDFGWWFSFVSD